VSDTVADRHYHEGSWYGTVDFGDGPECGYGPCENPWPGSLVARHAYEAEIREVVGVCPVCDELPPACPCSRAGGNR
jgi:hypothetical protein